MDTTKINSAVLAKATAKYRGYVLFVLAAAGVFIFAAFFTRLVTDGLTVGAKDNNFDALTSQRTQTELQLKDSIAKTLEAQKALDTATQEANKLRESRKNLDEQINSIINPSYAPKVEEVK